MRIKLAVATIAVISVAVLTKPADAGADARPAQTATSTAEQAR